MRAEVATEVRAEVATEVRLPVPRTIPPQALYPFPWHREIMEDAPIPHHSPYFGRDGRAAFDGMCFTDG
ncbi:hypothetical protein [Dictyobacter arantiisoli]|uniref:Uncharacterized protein n=1 Tax=Dictyobacter arantiisoli TaxID=2014874 RepID=A0A5A5TCG1_9CHLR|nr:hypothetical protein [Dictyobacter arantiisoli]GCF08836.1 hypothetical protein KDI_24000 [Dictyobacter arantiisoli]